MKFRQPPLPFGHPACLISTWFGVGLMPTAPGTLGSAAALPVAWGIMWWGGPWALAAATVVVTLAGWWAGNIYIRELGREDPGDIVVDEVAGYLVAMSVAPGSVTHLVPAFVLFRALDILKPPPIGAIDQRVGGGLGVVLDDVLAGVYTAGLLWLLDRVT